MLNTLVADLAQDTLYALVAVAGVVWLTQSRPGKARMVAEGALGLALVGLGIWLAARLHTDPRPFITDPASTPLFDHPADNGFPSDHSVAGGLLTVLVLRRRRLLGLLTGAGAAVMAWARVAAHVHHAQDVLAGLAIGVAAGAMAIGLVGLLVAMLARRGRPVGRRALTTDDRAARP